MCSDVHREMLSPDGMQRIRSAIAKTYPFLIHRAPRNTIEAIVQSGLLPSFPGIASDADIACVERSIGVRQPPILCLKPTGSMLAFGDSAYRIEFAIGNRDLPERFGVDWSCGGWWSDADAEWGANSSRTIEAIVLRLIRRYGTIASYDAVSSSALRVRLRSSPTDCSAWPLLENVGDYSDLYLGS